MLTFLSGVVSLALGVWMWTRVFHGHQLFRLFLKALAAVGPFCLVMFGVVAIIAGISSMKEKAEEKKEVSAAEKK